MNNSIKKRATRINTKTGFLEYVEEPTAKVYVNNYDMTEDDVLNRATMMSTGVYTVDTPQAVINQVNTQNAAIEEARRLAAVAAAQEAARQAAIVEANRLAAQAAAEEQNRLWIAEQARLNAIRIAEGEAKAAEALRISEAQIAAQVEATRQATLAAELVTQRAAAQSAAQAATAEAVAQAEYQAWVDRNAARWALEAQQAALQKQATAVQMIDIPVPQQGEEQKLIADVQSEVAENIVKEETAQKSQDDADIVAEAKRLAAEGYVVEGKKLGWFEQIIEYVYETIYKQD